MESRYDLMRQWLPSTWVPFEAIDQLYGIRGDDEALWGAFQAWALRLRRPQDVRKPDQVNRPAFETYLQQTHLLPLKIGAAHLGMELNSFEEILSLLEQRGILPPPHSFSHQVILEDLIREFHRQFSDLRDRVFGDYNSYCQRLHEAIKNDLGLEVAPLSCVTSAYLREDPVDYGHDFDCFTGEPIGLRYQVWLDFKKPMNLRPDACSLRFYAEHEEELKPIVFAGREPEIPEALQKR